MKTVLFLTRHLINWHRQFPCNETVWGDCRFIFHDDGRPYDYLVVWDRPAKPIRRRCAFANTIQVDTEPAALWPYDTYFRDQFARCLHFDPNVNHPGAISSPGYLNWLIGVNTPKTEKAELDWHQLQALFDEPRSKLISIIASNASAIPGHFIRSNFAKALKANFGDQLDLFGRGLRDMPDKAEALRGYRFHIAIENSSYSNYFSEKITDAFISGAMPIYWGCPNISEYFPENSYVSIDVADIPGSIKRIEAAISNNLDITHRDAVREARDRVFYQHNIFPALAAQIAKIEQGGVRPKPHTNNPLVFAAWIFPYPEKLLYNRVVRRIHRELRRFTSKTMLMAR